MNKIILLFITILLISNASSAKNNVILTDEEKQFLKENSVLRVQNELNWPPYNYFENGKAKGFSIDYIDLLAKKLDIEVEYVSGPSWNDFLQMLQNNKIDAIINISKNPNRENSIAFTSPFHIASNAIYTRTENKYLDTLDKLEGKTIIMPKGFFAQKAIEKYYPNIKQILVKDSLDALRLLSLGKADATVGKKNVLDYIIATNNISGVKATNFVNDKRIVSLLSIGTSKNKIILRDILEKAQKTVKDEEILKLKRKWFGQYPIRKKSIPFLDEDEINYIKARKIIRVCSVNNIKPISFEEDSKQKGISRDVLKKIEELIDVKFIFTPSISWEQTAELLKIKQCDIIATVTNKEDIKYFSNFTKPYLNYKLAIITQKDKSVVSSLNDIADKTMAIKKDFHIIPNLKENYPNLNLVFTNSNKESLEKVSKNKAYFTILPLPIASYYMSKYALKNLYISRYTNILYSVSMAIHKDNKTLLNILNKTLDQIEEEDYRKIFNKWTAVSFKQSIDYNLIIQIIITIILIVLIIVYRQIILNKHNNKLQEANNKIEEKSRELTKQKILFETLYNKSSDSVLLIKNKIIFDCNESTKNVLGYEKNQLINKYLYNLAPSLQLDKTLSQVFFEDKIKDALNFGVTNFEVILLNSENKQIWVEIVFTLIEIENEKVIHTVIRDISTRKALEKEFESLNLNLETKIKEEIKKNENNAKQLIQQSRLAQMGEMISMIAHQWRQPLTAIAATTNNLLVKLMLEEKINKEVLENELTLITEYSKYLSSTIDDFRNFFKPDKKKKIFNVEEIIKKSINITKTSIESKNIKLLTNFEKDLEVYSYSSQIQQVILNILKNAEDALADMNIDNKQIVISTYKRDHNNIVIKIYDNGGGIKDSIIDKIFDPYFSTKNDKDGTGLGLYMSETIIKDHCNGKLKAINENDGVSFLINLPIK